MSSQQGSCLCGAVKYQLNSEIMKVVNCHCDFCRSHSGAAFSTYAVLPEASLEITQGADKISSFQADEGKKHFCGDCGTPLYNLNKRYPGACIVYFGTLDDAGEITPHVNIWCDSKLPWVDELAAQNSFAEGVPRK